jgi:ADP-heptose:LPS heptosyltransferase
VIDPAWQAARRVLAVRLDNLGDVILAGPALRAVKRALPHCRLTLLTSPAGAQAGRLHPDLDEVIVYKAPWVDPWQQLPHDLSRETQVLEQLRAGRFDAAVIFTSYRQSSLPAAYLCYLAGIPIRHAASIDSAGSLLTSRHQHPDRLIHEVERGLDLVGGLGIPPVEGGLVLDVPPEARLEAERLLHAPRRQSRRIVVIHPGCSMPARTYPWQLYARVADLLTERLGALVVLTGTEPERLLTAAIREAMRSEVVDLAGALDFDMFCGLIAAADLTVTNNTGPMHVSAAVGTPVVTLFALTNPPKQWGPWQVPHRLLFHEVPCRLCYARRCPLGHECLSQVSPQEVVGAATELLRDTSGKRRSFAESLPA